MRAWAMTLEGYHENPYGAIGIAADDVDAAKVLAERHYRRFWRLLPGDPVRDVDDTAELWDDHGERVASFSGYGHADKIPRWCEP